MRPLYVFDHGETTILYSPPNYPGRHPRQRGAKTTLLMVVHSAHISARGGLGATQDNRDGEPPRSIPIVLDGSLRTFDVIHVSPSSAPGLERLAAFSENGRAD